MFLGGSIYDFRNEETIFIGGLHFDFSKLVDVDEQQKGGELHWKPI